MPTNRDILTLVQWFSPAFPVGAFAYSHGLETAVQSGRVTSGDALKNWLSDVLAHGSGRNDCLFLRAAYAAPDANALDALNETALAFAASAERQLEMRLQGEAFCKTTAAIWGGAPQSHVYPVAVGAAAARGQLNLPLTASMYLHSIVGNLVSAAQRLMRIGQTEGQAILTALTPQCEEIAEASGDLTLDYLNTTAFLSDIAAMQHEKLQSRIFRS